MTDMELFLAFYNQIGVPLTPIPGERNIFRIGVEGDGDYIVNSPRFDGYWGFYSDIEFNSAGAFVRQGFWE